MLCLTVSCLHDCSRMVLGVRYYRGYKISFLIAHSTKVGAMLSDPALLISGVIQGSVLGSLMFLVFINELAEVLAKLGIVVKLFAHDVKLYVKIMNDVDLCVLQHAIDALCRWAEEWQLTVSIDKCSVLHW